MKAHYTRQAPLAEIPIRLGRLWLGYRYSRYLLWSIAQRHGYGVSTAAKSLAKIGTLSALDLRGVRPRVECNICGWQGTWFYPNVGSGYFELNTTCARCHSIHRYRSLAAILETKTDFFAPDKAVIEVAPVRTFQACCLRRKQGKNYASFDLEGFGMEKGDITAMRYGDGSCDYFLCFHVLEHVLDDGAASGVIAAFDDGYSLVGKDALDYVVKFDGDLSFAPDFFESCLREFEADLKLGIAGGTLCKVENGEMVPEFSADPAFHVCGPTKIYRRECFEAIGGLIVAPGWDAVDQIKANMLGWRTCTFPNIRLVHLRPTGAAYGSWKDWVKNGLTNYITGYHPLFMATKCIRRMLRNPLSLEGPGLLFGFMKGYFQRIPQVEDQAMIRYLRQQQWRALTFRSNLWSRVPSR